MFRLMVGQHPYQIEISSFSVGSHVVRSSRDRELLALCLSWPFQKGVSRKAHFNGSLPSRTKNLKVKKSVDTCGFSRTLSHEARLIGRRSAIVGPRCTG